MSKNRRLFDALVRHQMYLEGVKSKQSNDFDSLLRSVVRIVRNSFSDANFDTFDGMTKRQLRLLLREIRNNQKTLYSAYNVHLEKMLIEFMQVDIDLSREIFETIAGQQLEDAYEESNGFPIWGLLAFVGTSKGDKKAWGIVKNEPIPANGKLMLDFISKFTSIASKTVEDEVKKAWANKQTKKEALDSIVGTKNRNFKDGVLSKTKRQATAVISTSIQHVSSIAQAGVASIFYRRYVWVSIIDGKTTSICLSRDGNIYVYGRGPLSPAHINCRSKTVPLDADVDEVPQTYYALMKLQPKTVQDDILGKPLAERLRSGDLKSKDFKKFANASPLSIAEFRQKSGLILTEG